MDAADQFTSRVDVVTLACSSCSFLWELAGARRQAEVLATHLGMPASNASLAYIAGLEALGHTRVGLASVYGPEITDEFVKFVAAAGVETVRRVAADAGSDRELASWDRAKLLELVERSNHADAEAIVLPETALHTASHLETLQRRAGKPVLTATQVTVWHALWLAGHRQAQSGHGALFRLGV